MKSILIITLVCGNAGLLTWIYLMAFRGGFWKIDATIDMSFERNRTPKPLPSVCVLVPARNESKMIETTLPALIDQHYGGDYHIYLIDDCSTDGTAQKALNISKQTSQGRRATVITGKPPPPNWTGKLWALHQGLEAADEKAPQYFLFTDADILYPPGSVSRLVEIAIETGHSMISVMARLHAASGWERLLIPAFIFFFAKLYPFNWVNDPRKKTAAAAGGCLLIKRDTLENIGGLSEQSDALIDDVALAKRIKRNSNTGGHGIWLGIARRIQSLRDYRGIGGIRQTVTRTAYHQLNYSPLLLISTVLGMFVAYLMPVVSMAYGFILIHMGGYGWPAWWMMLCGTGAWLIMMAAFTPIIKWYDISVYVAFLLPLAGAAYTLMTVESAVKYYLGRGGLWKGRTHHRERSNQ